MFFFRTDLYRNLCWWFYKTEKANFPWKKANAPSIERYYITIITAFSVFSFLLFFLLTRSCPVLHRKKTIEGHVTSQLSNKYDQLFLFTNDAFRLCLPTTSCLFQASPPGRSSTSAKPVAGSTLRRRTSRDTGCWNAARRLPCNVLHVPTRPNIDTTCSDIS